MQGVDIMRGKDPQARREQGVEKIVTAPNTYQITSIARAGSRCAEL